MGRLPDDHSLVVHIRVASRVTSRCLGKAVADAEVDHAIQPEGRKPGEGAHKPEVEYLLALEGGRLACPLGRGGGEGGGGWPPYECTLKINYLWLWFKFYELIKQIVRGRVTMGKHKRKFIQKETRRRKRGKKGRSRRKRRSRRRRKYETQKSQ